MGANTYSLDIEKDSTQYASISSPNGNNLSATNSPVFSNNVPFSGNIQGSRAWL